MGDLQIEDPCMHCLVTRRDRDRGLVVGDLQINVGAGPLQAIGKTVDYKTKRKL